MFSKYWVSLRPLSPVTTEPIPQRGGKRRAVPRRRLPGHLIPPPPRAAATCSASPATVNHVTVSSPRNPNPLARDPPGLPRHRDPLKPDATALRIKNARKWSPRAPCFVITVPLVSLYSAPPSFSSRRLRVNIGKRPARFCPNGYNIPSSRLRS